MIRTFLLLLVCTLCSVSSVNAMAIGLKVGVSADYPPMIYKQEGRIVGIEADNAKAVGGIIGQELTLVDMPFAKLIPALQAGEIDIIMSAMSVTPQRSDQVRLETIGENTQRQRLDSRNRLLLVRPIRHRTRNLRDFSNPTSVCFLLGLDS